MGWKKILLLMHSPKKAWQCYQACLRSQRAIHVNIQIIRAFVKLREILSTHKELAFKLKQLETKVERHDEEIQAIFEAIRQLMAIPENQNGRLDSELHAQVMP